MSRPDLRRLPRHTLLKGTELFRIHLAEHGAWHFSASGEGRFDPVDAPGLGAAYWAEQPLAAWVEHFRTRRFLAEQDVARAALSVVRLRQPLTVFDLTRRRGLAAGVTAALTAGPSYEEAQSLASRIAAGGRRGVRWRVRHDLSAALIGIALFGPAGPKPPPGLPRPRTRLIPPDLVAEAEHEFGYRVVPIPQGLG